VNKRLVKGGVTVSDDDDRRAIRFAYRELKLVVEPGGVATLAALLSGKVRTKGKTTVLVLSGGNIDTALFQSILRDD
jgi:threonine dehydratase